MMNDRFKFRAWNKEDKKMYAVEGVYAYEDEYTQGGEVFLQWHKTSHYFPEQVELMQCTGLKDKNGKLIYEGDCIKNLKTNTIYEVFWEQQATCFMLKSIKFGGVVSTYMMFEEYPNDLTKIGNIYENKELLNENE